MAENSMRNKISRFSGSYARAVTRLLACASLISAVHGGHLPSAYAQEETESSAYRGQRFYIEDVVIEGNRRVDTAAIRLQLKGTRGEVTEDMISEDVKTLYKTGFFEQVSVSFQQTPRSVLVFTVVEKPIVRKVFIKGNKEVPENELADVLTFGEKRFLDKARLNALSKNGVSFYQSRGFYDADVNYSVVPVEDGQVDVTFEVKEGEKFKIAEISINGLKEVDEDDLLTAIETKRYKWWSSWLLGTGRLNREMLENDRNLMRQYFLDHGYVDATVSEARIEKVDNKLKIFFDVNEGQKYTIGSVKATGDLIEGSKEKTLDGVKLIAGETFSASKIRADAFTISDKFGDQGYAFVNVVPQTSVDREGGKVHLDYQISKGKKVTINTIKVKGNTKTYDNVIRRELKVAEQETYSSSKVRRSEVLLKRLGYFEEVNIATEPATRDDQIDLAVNVREGPTGSFSIGAGYSTNDGAIFNSRISENNVFGTGKRLDLNLDLGQRRDNATLSYLDPRVNDSPFSFGVDGTYAERQFFDFDRKLAGGGFTIGYPLEAWFGEGAQDISTSLRYEYLSIEITNIDLESAAPLVVAQEGKTTSSAFTPGILRNTIDNPLNPSKGSRQNLSLELAGAGGDQQYYLVEARNQWYYPLLDTDFGNFVFSWRTRFGYGDTFDNEPFPLFRRFFPGGINSVRGFPNRSLGPKDEKGNEYGGSKEFVNNLELIFPLVNSAGLRGVVFFDAGEAFDDEQSIKLQDLRLAYGAGLRWASPMGPIRIEFGFPLDRESDEKSMVTLFSFGAPM